MEPGGSPYVQMGKTRVSFLVPPGPLIQDLNKNIALQIRFVGEGLTATVHKNATQVMKKLFIGIDISKEKLNLCFKKDLRTVLEEEVSNDVKSIKKALKVSMQNLELV